MMGRQCRIDGCDRPHRAKGLCAMHYERVRLHGSIIGGRPRNGNTVIARPRPPGEAVMSAGDRRRGEVRRAIEDREAELHLARMLADDDW